jgi:competence protein ComFC
MSLLKIRDFFWELKDDILDFVYPQSCPICQRPLAREEREICRECWESLARLPAPFCPYCKCFLEDSMTLRNHSCPCLSPPENKKIMAVRSLGTFDDYYQKLIHRFKYQKKVPLGKHLAQGLGEVLSRENEFADCDLIIPVPLHPARRRERGFNQSEILAEGIYQVSGIPIGKNILTRRKNTKDQTYLNAQQRAENVKDAFAVSQLESIDGKSVILVDDVITTGATLNECAEVLLQAGAKTVFASTLAVVVD